MNQNNNQIFVINGTNAGLTQTINESFAPEIIRRRIKKNRQQPVIDVIVVLVALPALTVIALLLEANTRGNWLDTTQSRLTVLGLAITLAVVCLAICAYVTTRLGGKMWSGAIPADGNGPHFSYYNPQMSNNEISDLPPSYEIVMSFDIPPPPYHSIVIDNDEKSIHELEISCPKYVAIQHI